MKDYEFITEEEALMVGTKAVKAGVEIYIDQMRGAINKLLNEKAQRGYSNIPTVNGIVINKKNCDAKYESFSFMRIIEEEKPEPATWAELQDVLSRYEGCTSCGSSNARCHCERDE